MKIAVLGTGMVGRAFAQRLTGLGHDVVIGTRDVDATAARLRRDPESLQQWLAQTAGARLVAFGEAGEHAELVVNATAGAHSLAALEQVGAERLAGRIVLDLAIPLDLSNGLPPALTVIGDDSLGEQLQRAFPDAHVVKALHTMHYAVMLDPARLPGSHSVFVAGRSAQAKAVVSALITGLGWPDDSIIDLGGIETARATEMYSRLFFAMHGVFGTFDFNIDVVRAEPRS